MCSPLEVRSITAGRLEPAPARRDRRQVTGSPASVVNRVCITGREGGVGIVAGVAGAGGGAAGARRGAAAWLRRVQAPERQVPTAERRAWMRRARWRNCGAARRPPGPAGRRGCGGLRGLARRAQWRPVRNRQRGRGWFGCGASRRAGPASAGGLEPARRTQPLPPPRPGPRSGSSSGRHAPRMSGGASASSWMA